MTHVLVESALRSTGLAIVVWLLLRAIRAKNARAEAMAWTLVLLSALAMPVLMQRRAITVSAPGSVHLPHQAAAAVNSAARLLQSAPAIPARLPIRGRTALAYNTWLAVGYAAVAGCLLLGVFGGIRRSRSVWKRGRRIGETWARNPEVRQSASLDSPATFATGIVFPPEWAEWDAAKLQAVLAHERAHVRWFDYFVLLAARVHRALFWFSPLAWYLPPRLSLSFEHACDEAALAVTEDRCSYAELLLFFSRKHRPSMEFVSMARSSTVAKRIDRILSRASNFARPRRSEFWVVLGVFLPLLGFVATSSFVTHAQTSHGQRHSWIWSSNSDDEPFVIMTDDSSVTMNGSSDDVARARAAQPAPHRQYIWFEHKGKFYVINDPATVQRAKDLFKPQQEMAEKESAHAKIESGLAAKESELAEREASVSVKMPDLEAEMRSATEALQKVDGSLTLKLRELTNQLVTEADLSRLEDQVSRAEGNIKEDDSDVQDKLEQVQSRLGELQSLAGEEQSKLGEQQSKLGEEQSKLGEQQSKLGEEQEKLAEQAARKLRTILEDAVQRGVARQVN